MIDCKAFKGIVPTIENKSTYVPAKLEVTITGESLQQFQLLLNRSLNCAPEFGRDWFELSDKLEAFLQQIK